MRKIHKKATAIFMVMIMVLGGMTGLLTPGDNKVYAAPGPTAVTISDENITSVVTSPDKKTVLLTTNVYMALKEGVSVTDAVYVKKTSSDKFVSVGTDSPNNTVTVEPTSDEDGDQTVFTLTFNAPLTGNAIQIQIQGQYFVAQDFAPYVGNAVTIPRDNQPPAYVGSYSNFGYNVSLRFDENFILNNVEKDSVAYLHDKMSISTNGVDFVALPKQMYVEYGSSDIFIENNNGMKVILGENTRLKIASDTFKDAEGNSNAEMILDITPPVVQSAAISEDNKKVTITFNESVSENTNDTEGSLKYYIYLLKNGGNSDWTSLTKEDTVSIEDGKLVIHFKEALVGAYNQIVVDGYALKDSAGNVENGTTLTPFIQVSGATDTTAPKLLNYYFSNDKTKLTFVFDEDVVSNVEDFNSRIHNFDPHSTGWRYGVDGTVEFSKNTVILHFNTPRDWYEYEYDILPYSLKDTAGNILTTKIDNDRIYPFSELTNWYGSFSNNGRLLNIKFTADLGDNTIVAGVSHLKEKIKVSTDQGENFLPLTAEDIVTIQGNKLVVLFHHAKKNGTIQVQVEADTFYNSHIPTITNKAIDTVIANNTPDVKGHFFSNAASEFVFEDDGVWSTKVRDVIVFNVTNWTDRKLSSSEYTMAAGKITINQGVFQEGNYYYLYIDVDGYSRKEVNGEAFTSSELYYMTAPVITTQGGILAKVNILRNDDINIRKSASTQTVVFELMNGTTPVSIVASELDVNTGTYSAQFNVIDGATNDNYTVRAFVVSHFSNDYTNVGLNLTTLVTQTEFDLMLNKQNGNPNDEK